MPRYWVVERGRAPGDNLGHALTTADSLDIAKSIAKEEGDKHPRRAFSVVEVHWTYTASDLRGE